MDSTRITPLLQQDSNRLPRALVGSPGKVLHMHLILAATEAGMFTSYPHQVATQPAAMESCMNSG